MLESVAFDPICHLTRQTNRPRSLLSRPNWCISLQSQTIIFGSTTYIWTSTFRLLQFRPGSPNQRILRAASILQLLWYNATLPRALTLPDLGRCIAPSRPSTEYCFYPRRPNIHARLTRLSPLYGVCCTSSSWLTSRPGLPPPTTLGPKKKKFLHEVCPTHSHRQETSPDDSASTFHIPSTELKIHHDIVHICLHHHHIEEDELEALNQEKKDCLLVKIQIPTHLQIPVPPQSNLLEKPSKNQAGQVQSTR